MNAKRLRRASFGLLEPILKHVTSKRLFFDLTLSTRKSPQRLREGHILLLAGISKKIAIEVLKKTKDQAAHSSSLVHVQLNISDQGLDYLFQIVYQGEVEISPDHLETFSEDLRVLNIGNRLGHEVEKFAIDDHVENPTDEPQFEPISTNDLRPVPTASSGSFPLDTYQEPQTSYGRQENGVSSSSRNILESSQDIFQQRISTSDNVPALVRQNSGPEIRFQDGPAQDPWVQRPPGYETSFPLTGLFNRGANNSRPSFGSRLGRNTESSNRSDSSPFSDSFDRSQNFSQTATNNARQETQTSENVNRPIQSAPTSTASKATGKSKTSFPFVNFKVSAMSTEKSTNRRIIDEGASSVRPGSSVSTASAAGNSRSGAITGSSHSSASAGKTNRKRSNVDSSAPNSSLGEATSQKRGASEERTTANRISTTANSISTTTNIISTITNTISTTTNKISTTADRISTTANRISDDGTAIFDRRPVGEITTTSSPDPSVVTSRRPSSSSPSASSAVTAPEAIPECSKSVVKKEMSIKQEQQLQGFSFIAPSGKLLVDASSEDGPSDGGSKRPRMEAVTPRKTKDPILGSDNLYWIRVDNRTNKKSKREIMDHYANRNVFKFEASGSDESPEFVFFGFGDRSSAQIFLETSAFSGKGNLVLPVSKPEGVNQGAQGEGREYKVHLEGLPPKWSKLFLNRNMQKWQIECQNLVVTPDRKAILTFGTKEDQKKALAFFSNKPVEVQSTNEKYTIKAFAE